MVYNNSSIKNKEILVHTNCSYNNTIITATDQTGNTISWSSGGTKFVKGTRRSTPFAAQSAAIRVGDSLKAQGIKKIHLFLKGAGKGRIAVAKGLQLSGLKVVTVTDKTPVPYNGCRPCKKRRI
jgi:small subunit ribosomal protein S11